MIDINSILESMEQRRTMLVEAGKLNKEVIFDALSAAGIERLTISFDGEGDSGQLNTKPPSRRMRKCPCQNKPLCSNPCSGIPTN